MYQILTWSATCCMWRVETVSKWEDKKKIITLLCAKKKHTANHDFAVCKKKHTANHDFAVCFGFAVCFL